jgi:mannan endo-1,4-beta-mannosidase
MSLAPQRNDGNVGWGNWTNGSDDFVRFQAQFYTDVKAQSIYQAHLDKILHRKNTITGRRYNEDATIMTWEPVNEPTSATQQEEDRRALNDWHNRTAHYIKTAAPNQLVTTGYEAKQSQEAFDEIHSSTAVDYTCGEQTLYEILEILFDHQCSAYVASNLGIL